MEARKVQLNLYVPEKYRDQLQRMAAKRMLENPRRAVSGATIAAEILCEHLESLKEEKQNLNPEES
jgi:hypothetical protein